MKSNTTLIYKSFIYYTDHCMLMGLCSLLSVVFLKAFGGFSSCSDQMHSQVKPHCYADTGCVNLHLKILIVSQICTSLKG